MGCLIALLSSCGGGGGGGGGGGDGGGDGDAPNVLRVTVIDEFGTKVPGATVSGGGDEWSTDSEGVAPLLIDEEIGVGNFPVTASREGFSDNTITTTAPNAVQDAQIVLTRATLAAGGSLTSRSGTPPTVDATAQQTTFEIELVIVDRNAQPIENLTASAFVLQPCNPDPSNGRLACVQESGSNFDISYVPVAAIPERFEVIPGAPVKPYAAALLIDQSGSIRTTDPTNARLSSAKAFLSGLGTDDRALLAAFAGAPDAKIPTPPLTVYPPFRDRSAAVSSYFAPLDSLAGLVGGSTPLYSAIDALRQNVAGDATLPAGLGKSIIVFTDGEDTTCDPLTSPCSAIRAATIQAANAAQVRLLTIGLSTGVDLVALAELANNTGGPMLYADSPEQLLPLYRIAGRLLSLSVPTYRLRWTISASEADAFASGRTVLGRVEVTTPSNTFQVPFVVQLPVVADAEP